MYLVTALTLLPCIIVLYWARQWNKSIPIARLFVLGMTAPLPAMFIEKILIQVCDWLPNGLVIPVTAFIAIAWVEEGLKFGVLRMAAHRKFQSMSIIDGAFCGALAAMGFSFMENIVYLLGSSAIVQVSLIRTLSAVPLHLAAGIIIGISMSRAAANRGGNSGLGGLLTAIAIHGFYDWTLMSNDLPNILIAPILIAAWALIVLILARARKKAACND